MQHFQNIQETKKFCRFLNNGLYFNNNVVNFTAGPCCYFSKVYEIDSNRESQQLTEHKQTWLQEDLTQTCKTCVNLEAATGWSYRKASFDLVTGEDDRIEILTVAVNKQCNLACASCNSEISSFWHRENIRNGITEPVEIVNMHQESRQGTVNKNFLSVLKTQDLSGLKYIKFGGGEPLMTDTHSEVLAMIPCPEQVTVQYTSNFSIVPTDRVKELWTRFKLIKWVASIDGTGTQFEILRWPYAWTRLENFVVEAKRTVPHNVMFGVEHTINPLNVFYYDKMKTWFDSNLAQNRYGDVSDFEFHICHGVLGLEHTPPEVRRMVQDRYGATHPITVSLSQRPWSGSTKQLVQYMNQLDQWRGTNWRQEFQEVQQHFYG